MTVQSQLLTLLSGATNAGTRVFALTVANNAAKPYVVYQRVSTNSENVMNGNSGLANSRIQIDVYADTYAQAVLVADQIDTLMNGWIVQNVSVLAQDMYEDAVKLFRVSQDYSVWHEW